MSVPQTESWGVEFRRAVPTLILAALTSFAWTWWSNQLTQNDQRMRLDALEKRIDAMSAQVSQNAATSNQTAVRMAESAIIQQNIVEQMKDLKEEQRRSR
jgi:hypothetical protein